MFGTIYGYRNKKNDADPDTIKIGSTFSFIQRMCVYKTQERNFNNDTHEIWKFEILESEYNCYQIDDLIQKMSIHSQEPYKHYNGDGGIEHYYFDGGIKLLSHFLKENNIIATFEKVDVNKLREDMKSIDARDAKNKCEKEDSEKIQKSVCEIIQNHKVKMINNTYQQILIPKICCINCVTIRGKYDNANIFVKNNMRDKKHKSVNVVKTEPTYCAIQ